ncbi:MAG: 3'-5' exonuclease [Anaerolineae bacterium]|nr:3'-5' exonuclease [Anaerolineae bacterium]
MVFSQSNPRELAIRRAQEILAQKPLYIDTETTGLDRDAEVIELAIVDDDGKVLMDQLFHPTLPIPKEATRVNHITDAMVANKPAWGIYWPTIRSLFFGKTLAAYNADYDLRLIYQSNDRYGIRRETLNTFCVMKLYAQYRGLWDNQRGRYTWFRLEQAGQEAGIPIPNSHRAVDDTLLTRALLHWIAEQAA